MATTTILDLQWRTNQGSLVRVKTDANGLIRKIEQVEAGAQRASGAIAAAGARQDASVRKTTRHYDALGREITQTGARGERALRRLEQRTHGVNSAMTTLGRTMKSLAVGAGLGTLGYAFFSQFRNIAEIEDSVGLLQINLDATADSLAPVVQGLRDIAKESRYTGGEVLKSGNIMAKAGRTGTEILTAMNATLDFATIAQIDLAEATVRTTEIMSIFNVAAGDVESVYDKLLTTQKNSLAGVNDIGKSFSRVGVLANDLEISIDELAAVFGVFADNGRRAEDAGTQFKIILERLINVPKGEAIEALERYGLSLDDINVKTRGFIPVLETLRDAQLDNAAMADLFGRRAFVLAKLLTGNIDRLKELTDLNEKSNGALSRGADIMDGKLKAAIKRVISAFEELGQSINDAIGDKVIATLDRLASSLLFVSENVGAFGGLAALGGSPIGISLMIAAFSAAFNNFGAFMKGLFRPLLDAVPLFKSLFLSMKSSLTGLKNRFEAIRWERAFQGAGGVADAIGADAPTTGRGAYFGMVGKGAAAVGAVAVKGLWGAFKILVRMTFALVGVFTALTAGLWLFRDALRKADAAAHRELGQSLEAMGRTIAQTVLPGLNDLSQALAGVDFSGWDDLFSEVMKSLIETIGEFIDWMGKWVAAGTAYLAQFFSGSPIDYYRNRMENRPLRQQMQWHQEQYDALPDVTPRRDRLRKDLADIREFVEEMMVPIGGADSTLRAPRPGLSADEKVALEGAWASGRQIVEEIKKLNKEIAMRDQHLVEIEAAKLRLHPETRMEAATREAQNVLENFGTPFMDRYRANIGKVKAEDTFGLPTGSRFRRTGFPPFVPKRDDDDDDKLTETGKELRDVFGEFRQEALDARTALYETEAVADQIYRIKQLQNDLEAEGIDYNIEDLYIAREQLELMHRLTLFRDELADQSKIITSTLSETAKEWWKTGKTGWEDLGTQLGDAFVNKFIDKVTAGFDRMIDFLAAQITKLLDEDTSGFDVGGLFSSFLGISGNAAEGSLDVPNSNRGGVFRLPGRAGTDTNTLYTDTGRPISNYTAGESLAISPAGMGMGGNVTVVAPTTINNPQGDPKQLERFIEKKNRDLERRINAALAKRAMNKGY